MGLRLERNAKEARDKRANLSQRIDLNQGADYKKILRLSYDVIITYDNRKSNLR